MGRDCGAVSTARGRVVLWVALACGALLRLPGASAAPVVEELPDGVRVATPYLSVEFHATNGGLASAVMDAGGNPLCLNQGIYTDWGIYAQRQFVGSAHAVAIPEVREIGERVVVTARGELRTEAGDAPGAPGPMAYVATYTFSDGPGVLVEWSATPGFDLSTEAAFFSFIMHTTDCRGVIARTESGVVLQDMATAPGRSFESSQEPLAQARPLLGLLRSDGTVLTFTGMSGQPHLANIFVHEGGRGAAGIFMAWQGGGASARLVAGQPWTGAFTLGVASSVEEALEL